MNDPNAGMLKVFFPGERLWALPIGKTYDGRIIAKLRNASVHGIPWDTVVVLATDERTIAEPEHLVALAEKSVEDVRREMSQEAVTGVRHRYVFIVDFESPAECGIGVLSTIEQDGESPPGPEIARVLRELADVYDAWPEPTVPVRYPARRPEKS